MIVSDAEAQKDVSEVHPAVTPAADNYKAGSKHSLSEAVAEVCGLNVHDIEHVFEDQGENPDRLDAGACDPADEGHADADAAEAEALIGVDEDPHNEQQSGELCSLAGSVVEVTPEVLCKQLGIEVIDHVYPEQSWSYIRDGVQIGTIHTMPNSLRATCTRRLQGKCSCWINCLDDVGTLHNDLIRWLASGNTGREHAEAHGKSSFALRQRYMARI